MNIFFLDKSPTISAEYMHDVHVRKMIVESAQLLSTANHSGLIQCDTTRIYKSTHKNHPMTLWVQQSITNYSWLLRHLEALLSEFTFRFDKSHKTNEVYQYLAEVVCPVEGEISPPMCMPDEYKVGDFVQSYRAYYREAKQFDKNGKFIGKYTKRNAPEFVRGN